MIFTAFGQAEAGEAAERNGPRLDHQPEHGAGSWGAI